MITPLPDECPICGKPMKKTFLGSVLTVTCLRGCYWEDQMGRRGFDSDPDPAPNPFPRAPADEKRCPMCDWKLLIHSESPRRRTVYCSNPRCSYKNELN